MAPSTAEEIQKKYDRLFDKVRQMRGVQKEYFKYRASSDLDKARRLERELDTMIKEEVELKKKQQTALF